MAQVVLRADDIAKIDKGLREAHRLKKFLLSDVPRIAGGESLNSTHYRTLMMLARHGALSMKGCYGPLGLEAGSFTPVADRLIEEGLVERRRGEADRRKVVISLTENGQEAVTKLEVIVKEEIRRKLSALDQKSVAELLASLETVTRVNRSLFGGGDE